MQVGEGVPTSIKGVCARHTTDVANFLRVSLDRRGSSGGWSQRLGVRAGEEGEVRAGEEDEVRAGEAEGCSRGR